MDQNAYSTYDLTAEAQALPTERIGCRDTIAKTEPAPASLSPTNAHPLAGVDVVMAPLCGITDSVFRRICLDRGADMVVTEMVSSEGLIRNSKQVRAIRGLDMSQGPLSIQIFGNDPERMGEAAEILSELNPRFLDMNFGCPVRKIVSKNGGSAVLRDPDLLHRICKRVVEKSSVPVSAKIRCGWDKASAGSLEELGSAIEGAGVSMVAVHARTKKQAFKGKANWLLIKQLKEAVSIPVIGNGDVIDAESYFKIRRETGCDAVMIGRGAIGNPWVFNEIKAAIEGREYTPPTHEERVTVLLHHVRQSVARLGEPMGLVLTRKIMAAYLKRLPNARELRGKAMVCDRMDELERMFHNYLEWLASRDDLATPDGRAALPAAG
jgi:nifR3 family TIM-barrel protein